MHGANLDFQLRIRNKLIKYVIEKIKIHLEEAAIYVHQEHNIRNSKSMIKLNNKYTPKN